MKINTKLKKISIMLLLAIIILNSTFIHFAYATDTETIKKISNPNTGEGEADGIVPGGDREASYAWAMTTRGNYVYIGTNKNIIGGVATSYIDALISSGATEEQAWSIINALTDNEIPKPTTTVGGEIFKCNITTGEIKKIFEADLGVAFRMAIEFEGMLYFGSYSGDPTATNYIYKIDEEDKVTVAFTSEYGTSMRAACIHDEELYFGGVDSRYALDEGDDDYVQLAIMKKDANDDTKWERVADYKDFKEYANDSAIKNNITSPIWDICSYDGYIYATIPNSLGIVMYKGHVAEGNEPANEYGWYWTEVIGKNSNVNNIGLAETVEGQIGDNAGLITMAATPFVFKDKLYLMNFDNTIQAEMQALSGLLLAISAQGTENEPDLTNYLKPMYTTLNNPQILWVYDDTTGKFNEVESFSQFMEGTCNEYLWRTEVYNDELYITTMDSAVLYNWAIQFTGEHFTRLTPKEIDSAITEIDELLKKIERFPSLSTQYGEAIETLKQAKIMISEYKTVMDDSEKFNEFVVKNEILIGKIEAVSNSVLNSGESNPLIAGLVDLASQVDWDGLRMYAYIVRMVEEDTWGFDLLKTSDGENFEVVTDSGFGDKYNYGGRSLTATEKGLYLGTANPFYGAQLWKISNGTTDNPNEDNPNEDKPNEDNPNEDKPNEDNPNEDKPNEDNPNEDNPNEDKPNEDNPNEDNPNEDKPNEDNPNEDKPNEDKPNEDKPNEDRPSQDTGISKEELDAIKQQLDTVIKNQEKFEEEIKKLNEEITNLKNNNKEDGAKEYPDDDTTSKGELPKTGNPVFIITLAVVFSIATITAVKYIKYRKIDRY